MRFKFQEYPLEKYAFRAGFSKNLLFQACPYSNCALIAVLVDTASQIQIPFIYSENDNYLIVSV